jgi:hypothetical protein
MIVYGGRTNYGQPIGILMLDTVFPRIPGDVGNGFTFDFPVLYKIVRGANPKRVVQDADPALLEPFIEGLRELEAEGCQAVSTSCGFLVIFQKRLAEAARVPVLTSSLLQVPFLAKMLRPEGKIGIITARASSLTDSHFAGAGMMDCDFAIQGMDDCPEFSKAFFENRPEFDPDIVRDEVVGAAKNLVRAHPNTTALVFECTNLPPYARAVQQATGLPVFDITTLIRYVAGGLLRGNFSEKAC